MFVFAQKLRLRRARRCVAFVVAFVMLLLAAAAVALPAGAASTRRSVVRHGPSLSVRHERHDGTVVGIVFREDVDAVSVRGMRGVSPKRIDQTLASYLASSRRRFEAGLLEWQGQRSTPPFHLTIRAIGTHASRLLTSVVYQSTVESTALAHQFSWFDAFNFGRDGQRLSLLQVVQPGGVDGIARAASPALAQLLAERGNPGCASDPRSIAVLLTAGPDQPAAHVGFTRSGALVAFDDYSLNYYACGYATIRVPYDALAGVIRPQFLPRSVFIV